MWKITDLWKFHNTLTHNLWCQEKKKNTHTRVNRKQFALNDKENTAKTKLQGAVKPEIKGN